MKLFGLFNSTNKTGVLENPSVVKKSKSKLNEVNYNELFLDFLKINKGDFVEIGEDTNAFGNKFKRYSKSLVKTEMDMFNEIEICEFESGDRNIYLRAPVRNIKLKNIEELVENLHKEFGEDMFGNSGFDHYDENSINRSFWTGRIWNKRKPGICLKLMNDCLELSVLGVKKK